MSCYSCVSQKKKEEVIGLGWFFDSAGTNRSSEAKNWREKSEEKKVAEWGDARYLAWTLGVKVC